MEVKLQQVQAFGSDHVTFRTDDRALWRVFRDGRTQSFTAGGDPFEVQELDATSIGLNLLAAREVARMTVREARRQRDIRQLAVGSGY